MQAGSDHDSMVGDVTLKTGGDRVLLPGLDAANLPQLTQTKSTLAGKALPDDPFVPPSRSRVLRTRVQSQRKVSNPFVFESKQGRGGSGGGEGGGARPSPEFF